MRMIAGPFLRYSVLKSDLGGIEINVVNGYTGNSGWLKSDLGGIEIRDSE